jgi:site-specific recombinase XerC
MDESSPCLRCGWVIGLLLHYTGLRVEEIQGLDVDDMLISSRRRQGRLRDDKGNVYHEVTLHCAARTAICVWLDDRAKHRSVNDTTVLFHLAPTSRSPSSTEPDTATHRAVGRVAEHNHLVPTMSD